MPKIKSLDKNHLLISRQKTEWEFCLRLSEWEMKKEEIGEMPTWDRPEIQGDFLFSNPNSFFCFIKGTSKNKVTRFFKASASPSASQQKFKFPIAPNKSLTSWFCFPCVPQFMADPQKVSAHLIYFCDLPDLANLRFLLSANDRVTRFFFLIFFVKLDKSSLDCREKNHNNKKKRSKFFSWYFGLGRCGDLEFLSIVFFVGESFFELFRKVNSFLSQKKWEKK
jgi:hypothetical protein